MIIHVKQGGGNQFLSRLGTQVACGLHAAKGGRFIWSISSIRFIWQIEPESYPKNQIDQKDQTDKPRALTRLGWGCT